MNFAWAGRNAGRGWQASRRKDLGVRRPPNFETAFSCVNDNFYCDTASTRKARPLVCCSLYVLMFFISLDAYQSFACWAVSSR
jgi:hypothetical protein